MNSKTEDVTIFISSCYSYFFVEHCPERFEYRVFSLTQNRFIGDRFIGYLKGEPDIGLTHSRQETSDSKKFYSVHEAIEHLYSCYLFEHAL